MFEIVMIWRVKLWEVAGKWIRSDWVGVMGVGSNGRGFGFILMWAIVLNGMICFNGRFGSDCSVRVTSRLGMSVVCWVCCWVFVFDCVKILG